MSAAITSAYSQEGGELPYFVGAQYGSGWLRTLGRFAFPILKKVLGVAAHTAKDVLVDEKPVLTSLRDNAISEAVNTLGNSGTSINRSRKRQRRRTLSKKKQTGSGNSNRQRVYKRARRNLPKSTTTTVKSFPLFNTTVTRKNKNKKT